MTRTMSIHLAAPAHEMAQEEIQKQVAYLSRDIARPRFSQGGAVLEFDVPEGEVRLLGHPAPQAGVQRHVGFRVERSRGERVRGY